MKKIILSLLLLIGFIGFAQDEAKIQSWLDINYKKSGLVSEDIKDWTVKNTSSSKSTKITNYHVQQHYNGIEIFTAISNFAIKNGEVIHVGERFVSNVAQKSNSSIPAISVTEALAKAYLLLDIKTSGKMIILDNSKKNRYKISNGFSEKNPVKALLVYQETSDNTLKLAWDFTIHTPDRLHVWSLRIDAATGEMLERNDLMLSCEFESELYQPADAQSKLFSDNFFKTQSATPFQVSNSAYRVIPFDYTSPLDHERVVISNPYKLEASPKGWHDTNNVGQNNQNQMFTKTQGNNVYTVDDWDGDNEGGAFADGSSELIFDFPFSGSIVPATNSIDAALTNLFYMNNMLHDLWHHYGFDEANGNFQHTNYSDQGIGLDEVFAQSQDRGQTTADGSQIYNNANFYTPDDGENGIMQMYLYNIKPAPICAVNSPASVAGNYATIYPSFSLGNIPIPSGAGLTADVTEYQPPNSTTCFITNRDFTGKIVLLHGSSSCLYSDRVYKAQLAGAVAVILVSNNPTGLSRMGGAGNALITIPAISISQTDGNAILSALLSGAVNMTLIGSEVPFYNLDSSFDNGIIAHEYGHGISNRLTGGANASVCLQNAEQAGEGWSDWISLMVQLKPGDVGTTPKMMANYTFNYGNNGRGIRTKPYSTDFAVNNLTFNSTNIIAPHTRGEFMATVLWDLTWAYIEKYGFDSDIYNGTGGNNKVMQLVMDGLKLQPCSPTFIEFREALFLADNATTNGADFCMIAEIFRKRGMGANSTSGSRNSAIDQQETFTAFAPGANCLLATNYFESNDLLRVYPNPSNGLLTIHISKFSGSANIQVIDINGRAVFTEKTTFNLEKSINISTLQSGIYILKINGDGLNYTQKIIKK